MKRSLLILGAFACETDSIKQATLGLTNVNVLNTGVGLINASVGTQAAIDKIKAECDLVDLSVVFVGSVGTIDSDIELLSPVIATDVRLADYGLFHNLSYFPKAIVDRYESDAFLISSLESISLDALGYKGPVYSTLSITKDKVYGHALSTGARARFENLELFSVALVCENNSIPWASYSVVTNYLSEEAHKQWLQNSPIAAKKTGEVILKLAIKYFS
jgi:nucleoside phosphorylase